MYVGLATVLHFYHYHQPSSTHRQKNLNNMRICQSSTRNHAHCTVKSTAVIVSVRQPVHNLQHDIAMRYLQFCLRSFVATQRTLLTHNTLVSLIQFPLGLYWAIYCDDITLSYTCKFHLEVSSCYSIHVLSAVLAPSVRLEVVIVIYGPSPTVLHLRPVNDLRFLPSRHLAAQSEVVFIQYGAV